MLEKSATNRVLIFKHSTQCSISSAAYDEFLEFAKHAEDITCGVVLVIENRALSAEVAKRLGIRHESPQAIVVENGQVTWNASHWSISAAALTKALRD